MFVDTSCQIVYISNVFFVFVMSFAIFSRFSLIYDFFDFSILKFDLKKSFFIQRQIIEARFFASKLHLLFLIFNFYFSLFTNVINFVVFRTYVNPCGSAQNLEYCHGLVAGGRQLAESAEILECCRGHCWWPRTRLWPRFLQIT